MLQTRRLDLTRMNVIKNHKGIGILSQKFDAFTSKRYNPQFLEKILVPLGGFGGCKPELLLDGLLGFMKGF